MICFPNAKINLGLNVIEKLPDGFHNIETVFYPVKLSDTIEVFVNLDNKINLKTYGNKPNCVANDNLCVKAYNILKKKYNIPFVDIKLIKNIPTEAGLGGGSADAAFTLIILNNLFKLSIREDELFIYASEIGSDCAFFIKNIPVFAYGKGNVFENTSLNLSGNEIIIVKPNFGISTKWAYSNIKINVLEQKCKLSIKEIIDMGIDKWKEYLTNDFENIVISKYPEIKKIKEEFYKCGAKYSSLSGSGSSVYGIGENLDIEKLKNIFSEYFFWNGYL